MTAKRYRVMNHDDYELDYIADSQQGLKKVDLYDCCDLLNENEQLKQRNNRQYEQLGRLYNLIEQKEWRVLTDIIDDFKKSDEQLQKEWETYGDVE